MNGVGPAPGTYNVKIWKTRVYHGVKATTYSVRWGVNSTEHRGTFPTAALADAFRAELVTASRRGAPFDVCTGLPACLRPARKGRSWYEAATNYADLRWPHFSANHRQNVARTLTAATLALSERPLHSAKPQEVRTALREFGFNRVQRPAAPPEVKAVLEEAARHSPDIDVWMDSAVVRRVLADLSVKLDGTPAAPSALKRHRRVLNPLLGHLVAAGDLPANPLAKYRPGAAERTNTAVDRRCLANPDQAAALLGSVYRRRRGGRRLHAFFAALYYTGPRPEEAVALRVADVDLPGKRGEWGEMVVHRATPEVGSQWSSCGTRHEERHLKGRSPGDTRVVPVHPVLAGILADHIREENLAPTSLLFQGEGGGVLAGAVYRRAWDRARLEALTVDEYLSPLARRVYDLRHTCLTAWLNAGVPPAQVAQWAGNSVPVLLETYARCIAGQGAVHRARIMAALPGHDPATGQSNLSPDVWRSEG